ncbi:MAG: hypothetical protein JWR50_724 [Mucilaginibacter sp.]|nr:hypothetical protein [Mucilaginibacter sp.]
MNFQQLHKQRKILLISSLTGIIACFLPWYSFFTGSVNGMNGMGSFVFLLFIAAGIMAFTGDQKITISSKPWLLTIAAGAINIAIIGYYIIRFESATSGMDTESSNTLKSLYGNNDYGLGIGIWLTLATAIVVTVSAYIFRSPGNKISDSYNELIKDTQKAFKNAE